MGLQLQPGTEIAGISALKVRDLFRALDDNTFMKEWLHEKGIGKQQASRLVKALLEDGYIQLVVGDKRHEKVGPSYRLTEHGRTLMRAKGSKPVRRETAKRVLDEFMARVHVVNGSPDFIVKVTEVIVFGSYLGDKQSLGDLDIAWQYENKVTHVDQDAYVRAMVEHFDASGRASKGFMSALYWPWEQVHLFLKSKKRTLSLHTVDELEQMIRKSDEFRFEVLLGDREAIVTRSKSRSL
jgi:hypothetical protein